jgi:hypothetical protein
MLSMNDLELARTIALDPTLGPSELGVWFFEEGLRSCPVRSCHNGGMRKSRFRLQEMWH